MLSDVFTIEMSLGSTQKAWEEVSQAVAQPVEQLQELLPCEAVLNADETGRRTNGAKRWMWTLVAKPTNNAAERALRTAVQWR